VDDLIVGYGLPMAELLLGALAVWILWTLTEHWLEASKWIWYLLAIGAGVGWATMLNPSWWWQGIGVGGGAAFLYLLADLVALATDRAKVQVLRNTRTGP
jgi:beta-lactamase superfamily II metal-dependent hydrolase